MTFSMICVGLVIIVAILGISALLGFLISDCTTAEMYVMGWLINGFCFGVCLTILLYQNGIL